MIERRVVTMVVVCSCACGSDGPSRTGSGVAADKSLAELTDEEAVAVWQYRDSQLFRPTAEQDCTVSGIVVFRDVEMCRAHVPSCLEQARMTPQPDGSAGPLTDDQQRELLARVRPLLRSCSDVTVGALERCARGRRKTRADLYEGVSCNGAEAGFEGIREDAYIPGCEDVSSDCRF